MTPKELAEKRARLVAEARALEAKADAENRDLTADEKLEWNRRMDESDAIAERIERELRMQRASETDGRVAERRSGREDGSLRGGSGSDGDREVRHAAWFREYLRRGGEVPAEFRDMSAGAAALGGSFIPQGFAGEVAVAMKDFSGVLQAAREVTTSTGAALPWPTSDDTGNVGEQLSENVATATLDVPTGSVTFQAYIYSSKGVGVSNALIQDSAFGLDEFLKRAFAERIGRILNQRLTTGTGSSQPNGVVTASSVGKTGATGQTTSVIYDDLVDLMHSVDPAYRRGPQVGFMMNDASVKVVRKLKDSQNRPLWEPNVQAGQPDTLLGYPLWANADMATMAANAKSILFGDFSQYVVRKALDPFLMRSEHYAMLKFQTVFAMFSRYDGNFIGPTSALKHYANSAT